MRGGGGLCSVYVLRGGQTSGRKPVYAEGNVAQTSSKKTFAGFNPSRRPTLTLRVSLCGGDSIGGPNVATNDAPRCNPQNLP